MGRLNDGLRTSILSAKYMVAAIAAGLLIMMELCFMAQHGSSMTQTISLRIQGGDHLRSAHHYNKSSIPLQDSYKSQGVICTMVKDENRHLTEWVQFHLVLGATKVVLYDDNSVVSPAAALRSFGESVVIHRMRDIGDPPAYLAAHADPARPYLTRQQWAFNHCAANHGGGHGWLAVIDTDEYIFPCRGDTGNSLWEAFSERVTHPGARPNATAAKVECLKFGFNDFNRPLEPGKLQIESHTRRAPYKEVEPHLQHWALKNLTGCTSSSCLTLSAHKVIYTLEAALVAKPMIHGPLVSRAVVLDTSWNRTFGVCCNHYMLRGSAKELMEKSSKSNYTSFYTPMTQPDPSRWYTAVPDTLIWQYLRDLKTALQERGLL